MVVFQLLELLMRGQVSSDCISMMRYKTPGVNLTGEASGDQFGWSESISRNRVATGGARRSDGNGSNSGQVRIYEVDETFTNC